MSTLAELQDYLATLNEAISRVIKLQSYQMPDGRRAEYPQLTALLAEKRRTEQQISIHPDNTTSHGRLSHAQAVFGGRR